MPNQFLNIYKGPTLRDGRNWMWIYKPDGSREAYQLSSLTEQAVSVQKWLSRQGVSTPNYEVKRKAGNLPVNPFSYTSKLIAIPTVDSGYDLPNSGSGHLWGTFTGPMSVYNPLYTYYLSSVYYESGTLESADREAKSRALAELKSQKVNIAQFFAERKQTIALIADSAAKIAGFLSRLKKGDIVGAGKALGSRPSRRIRRNYRELRTQSVRDATADAWLAMQYGWKPLLSDVYGAVDMLVERTSDIQRFMAKSKAVRSEERVHLQNAESTFMRWRVTQKTKVTVKYTFMFDVEQAALAGQGRLGLTNPLLLAWELVPYSFVVDWFLPIGNALSSLDATIGLKFQTGAKVVRIETNTRFELEPWTEAWQGRGTAWGTGEGYGKVVSIERTVENFFPSPQMPELKNPLSVTHALNALALLSGVVSRRNR